MITMKKRFIILFILLTFSFFDVKALEPSKLITANEKITIDTEIFTYNNLYFVDNNGNKTIYFDSINNKLTKKAPISFSIGLFDQENKNIGLINYCSSEDLDSAFANYYVPALGYTTFNLNVTPKYLIDGKISANVYYISFLDSNKYCKIGGADNYKDKTYEEIIDEDNILINNNNSFLKKLIDKGIIKNIIYFIIIIILYFVYCNIIDLLYRNVNGHSSNLTYIPIVNIYLASKLAFGQIVAIGNIILTLLGIGLVFLNFKLLMYLMVFLNIISFLAVVIKLITKKYDMFIISFKLKDSEDSEEDDDDYNINENEAKNEFLDNEEELEEDEKIDDTFKEIDDINLDEDVKVEDKDSKKDEINEEKPIPNENTIKLINDEENNNDNEVDDLSRFFK